MQKITSCLWFDNQAQFAADFYVSLFSRARILETTYYMEDMPKPAGSVMTVRFEIEGREFLALNAGPEFKFTPAISQIVYCDDQAEVDRLWYALCEEGAESQCGWLQDRFGLSWQIVPRRFIDLLATGERAGVQRALAAMMQMKKLELARLLRAYGGADQAQT